MGVHNFIVPVRDMETHEPLPGKAVKEFGCGEISRGWRGQTHASHVTTTVID